MQSRQAYQEGKIVRARTQGLVAAYLWNGALKSGNKNSVDICAVFTALMIAVIVLPFAIIGLYTI